MASNFKNVLKVFKLLRDFDSDDHALLNTLRNATEADIELLIEAVGPVKRATVKRTRKSTSKSRRAASIAGAIQDAKRGINSLRCVHALIVEGDTVDGPCGQFEINAIHDPSAGYAGYHPFQPAQPVAGQLLPNGEEQSLAASSVTETESAGVAVNAGG